MDQIATKKKIAYRAAASYLLFLEPIGLTPALGEEPRPLRNVELFLGDLIRAFDFIDESLRASSKTLL